MFFLGVASTFLPYLIGFGLLFVLSLGINSEHEVEIAELDNKKIENYKIDSQTVSTDENSYYFFQTQAQEEANQLIADCTVMPEYVLCKTQLTYCDVNKSITGFDYGHRHSGLSPPALVS